MNTPEWVEQIINKLDAEKALKTAIGRGGDLAEFYWEDVTLTSVVMEDGRLERVVAGSDSGASLRTVFNDHQAFGATNELNPARLLDVAGTVAGAVGRGGNLDFQHVSPGRFGPDFLVKIRPETVGAERKIDLIRRAEAAARAYDSRIRQVKVVYGDRVQKVVILNSEGVVSADERISSLFIVQVVAADNGIFQVGYEPVGGAVGFELLDDHPPEEVARKAASRAIRMLEADEAPAGVMPVILSAEAGGTMIHEAVGHGLEADLAGEGLSVYSDQIGREVASPLITVLDDATLPHRRGSFAIDDEGTPAQKTVLVENGVLKTYMHDRRSARKMGAAPTGNGRRESFRHRPVVRMTNTLIAPGKSDPADILSSTPEGLFVRKMGGGQVNTVNGDFVFEVSEGYLIENGSIGRPVRGATLTGNGPEVLKQIDMVGADLGFGIGTCGKDGQGVPVADAQPTLRMPQIVVGGRAG